MLSVYRAQSIYNVLTSLFEWRSRMKQHKQTFVKKKHLTPQIFYCMIPKVMEMEKKVLQTYLYDFYGELLTQHQRMIYEDFVLQDLSLSEIAEEQGISRQGVHDLVKRCDRLLEGYEEKLHLLERFLRAKKKIEQIHHYTVDYENQSEEAVMAEIRRLSSEILEEL